MGTYTCYDIEAFIIRVIFPSDSKAITMVSSKHPFDAVKYFKKNKKSVNDKNGAGSSCLHIACWRGSIELVGFHRTLFLNNSHLV